MPLPFSHRPRPGDVLICDFDSGFTPPEMVKKRPVIVVSTQAAHGKRGLCTVVPLSTTAPVPVQVWHHPLPALNLPGWSSDARSWAKCDMLGTVSYQRLNKPYIKGRHGRRYSDVSITAQDLQAIQNALRVYLCLVRSPV